MKKIMIIILVVFINYTGIGQDLTGLSMKLNNKLRLVSKQIDSLKNIKTSLEKELDSIKVIEFNKKKTIDANEIYVVRWSWKSFEKGEKVEIVKLGDKMTIVNTALHKNVDIPTYYLVKEKEFIISENEKTEQKKKDQEIRMQAEKEEKLAIEKRKSDLIKKYGVSNGLKIFEEKIWIGMTKEMLIESWGRPNDINRTVGSWGVHEQCIYSSAYVYIENGIVTSWQD